MSLIVKDSGGTSYPPIEAGTYPARCVGLIDLGLQHNDYNGKDREMVRIVWELPTELIHDSEGDKPRWISKPYTASLHEKATLRKDLDAWRGKPFDKEELKGFELRNIINAPCLLTIVHQQGQTGSTYAKVSGVSRVMRGMAVPPLVNPTFCVDLSQDNAEEVLITLPQWMQDEVKKSPTWAERAQKSSVINATVIEDVSEDEEDGQLPF